MDHTRNSNQIFGTPPEPLFNHRCHSVSPQLLQDWMSVLAQRNNRAVASAKYVQGSAITSDSVQFLFCTCERLRMPSEVKYLSLELFDRFMIQHIVDLHEYVLKTNSVKNKTRDWREIRKRVGNQLVLRVVSCIQIASKLTSHYRVLSPGRARRLLLESGHKYNAESILNSELRILKTLNFCVSVPSPQVYLESILEVLGEKEPSSEVKILYGVSQKLLDMVYLRYGDVYDRLHDVAASGSPITDMDREHFACVRADKMLLTATLITSAAYIVDRHSHEMVLCNVSKITAIPVEDISDFASVVLQILMEANED